MKKLPEIVHSLLFVSLFFLSACNQQNKNDTNKINNNNQTITIAVSSNAQLVIDEIIQRFTKKTGIKVETVVSSSGKLSAQIQNGAPFSVFISADLKYPIKLYEGGLSTAPPQVYAEGMLALWTKTPIDTSNIEEAIYNKNIRKIAIADPKTAPYGELAMVFLKPKGDYRLISDKIVFGESISQINQYISIEAVDIAFTAYSSYKIPELADKGWIYPLRQYSVEQGVVILSYAKKHHLKEASAFYNFLLNNESKNVFRQCGCKYKILV